MNPTIKNILIITGSVIAGGVLNMLIVMISGFVIPPPAGADVTTMEGLKASLHLFEPKHFVMPFLAHALGTLLAAFLASKYVSTKKLPFALAIGAWFLLGGIMNVVMLPSPLWFTITDLVGAYLPMAYLGAKLSSRTSVN